MVSVILSEDPYGLKVSSGGASFDAWLEGLDASLAFDKSGIKELNKAVALNPDFALAHATLARQQFNYGFPQEALRSLDIAIAMTHSVTAREASQINVADAAMRNEPTALQIATAHLEEWPVDVFVFSQIVGPFGLLAFSGRKDWRQQCVQLLEQYRPHWPEHDWWFLTTLAFSLAETGRLGEAEMAAERALQIRPTGNCAHSLSHVHFEQQASETGYAFLHQWIKQHGQNSDMRHHLVWHTALLDLEEGKASSASMLDLYCRELDPKVSDPQPLTTFSDNASLLWRCTVHGMPLPEKFAMETLEYGQRYYPTVGFVFADIHKIIVAALTHPQGPGLQLLADLEQLEDRHTAALMTGLWQGFTAFAEENYAAAADLLRPLLDDTVLLGGSNPQRRIVEETYFEACARAGETTAAVSLLQDRLAARPSRHDQRILAQLQVTSRDRQVTPASLGLEGVFPEQDIPLPMRRAGMAEWRGDHVKMLDRRALPAQEKYLRLRSTEEVAEAIEKMVIQGAFSIAIAAGYGLALSAAQEHTLDLESLKHAAGRLIKTRPTGLAIQRMMAACLETADSAAATGTALRSAILATVDQAAVALARQGYETGKNACDLLPDGATILTHCFPDRSYVYLLMETARRNKQIKVICSETRPYLQGARLTALCAQQAGFSANVITDGMGGFLMRQGKIDAFISAADRVCMDGAVCNKVGTYQYALAAHANHLPYYALRQSGPDTESANENSIELEYRDGDEVIYWAGVRTTPQGVSGLYPSFDITPAELVSSIVTDRGIFEAARIADYLSTPAVITDAIL